MANSLKVGDIVQLKSGGPKMTVTDIYQDGRVGCVWFVGADQKEGTFPPDAVQAPPTEQVERQRPPGGGGGQWS
jgi:uncharacterized protein YodC (DUF2158 family)